MKSDIFQSTIFTITVNMSVEKVVCNDNNLKSIVARNYESHGKIIVDVSNIDTTNCSTFEALFEGFKDLKYIIGFEKLNTSNVKNMNRLFNGCKSLIEINLSNCDLSNVCCVNHMFNGCDSLTGIKEPAKYPSNVDAYEYIQYCLNEVNINHKPIDEQCFNKSNHASKLTRSIEQTKSDIANLEQRINEVKNNNEQTKRNIVNLEQRIDEQIIKSINEIKNNVKQQMGKIKCNVEQQISENKNDCDEQIKDIKTTITNTEQQFNQSIDEIKTDINDVKQQIKEVKTTFDNLTWKPQPKFTKEEATEHVIELIKEITGNENYRRCRCSNELRKQVYDEFIKRFGWEKIEKPVLQRIIEWQTGMKPVVGKHSW